MPVRRLMVLGSLLTVTVHVLKQKRVVETVEWTGPLPRGRSKFAKQFRPCLYSLDGVMQGRIAYRQLVLTEGSVEKLRLPLTTPVNDLLGQYRTGRRNEPPIVPRANDLYDLLERYASLSGPRGVLGDGQKLTVHGDFLAAAGSAAKGRLSARIAPYVERLRFAPDGSIADVPDFTALAAWSLLEAVRRQRLELRTCPTCKGKWLASPEEVSRYCQRRAPGQVSKDCRTLDYEKRLAGDVAYRAYRREYKRLTELQRRGSLDSKELVHWRDQNSPAQWLPFNEWKEGQHG
jgi:Zn-finger nucleic acid-binding protein